MPLSSLPRDVTRLARQKAFFAALASGKATDKLALLGNNETPLAAGMRHLRAASLPHRVLTLDQGQTVLAETRGLSPGGDPVLHLWDPARQVELARDDDSGDEPGAARLRHTVQTRGTYLLVLRAFSAEDDGICDLWIDGKIALRGALFGGTDTAVSSGREVQLVRVNDRPKGEAWPPCPRASADPLLLVVERKTGALVGIDDDSGVELGSRATMPRDGLLALAGTVSSAQEGSLRLVVNDNKLADSDGDGLGDGLERSLCLCGRQSETICGHDCAAVTTPQDSDADGLSDAEELLGLDHELAPLLLPRWGADPRHKDLFVEVDVADYTDESAKPPLRHYGRTPTAAEAQLGADTFAALTAMHNPDGKPGIRLHLDLGHACGSLPSGIDAVCGDFCSLGRDGTRRCGNSSYLGRSAGKRDNLAPGRLHRFHLAVADCLVAGSAPVYADTLEYDCARVSAMVHELGHNLGLARHYGTVETGGGNCKPNYPSLMNYAYSDRFGASRRTRFSHGALVGSGDIDPLDIDETKPYGGAGADISWLATRPFFYRLHNCRSPGVGCQVDFNRDGKLDPSVRANISPMPNYGWICENIHGNVLSSENIEGLVNTSGPAGAELEVKNKQNQDISTLFVLATERSGADVRLRWTRRSAEDKTWAAWQTIDGATWRTDTQPAAVAYSPGSDPKKVYFFACVDGQDPIRYGTISGDGVVSAVQKVPGQPAGLRARDVSLALWRGDLLLLMRDAATTGGDAVLSTRFGPAGWSGSFARLSSGGFPLRSTVTPAGTTAADGRFYLVSGDPRPDRQSGAVGRLHLYRYSGAGLPLTFEDLELSGLRFEDGAPNFQHVLWSRPALVFVPHLDGKGQPLSDGRGYLKLWYTRGSRTRYLWTWGRLDRTGADFTLGRWHHYEAFGYTNTVAGSGPALVVRRGYKLTALLAQSDLTPGKVRHIPNADGLPDKEVVFRDHDDRPTLRGGLCPSLNWDCRDRCRSLTAPCKTPAMVQPPVEVQCQLPRWP